MMSIDATKQVTPKPEMGAQYRHFCTCEDSQLIILRQILLQQPDFILLAFSLKTW